MASRGRLAFTSPSDLQAAIDEYFEGLRVFVDEVEVTPDGNRISRTVEVEPNPPTMAGLAHHLGVVRKTLFNYEERDEFTPVIARAKNRIAIYAETMLYHRDRARGAMFALNVNHGYGKENEGGSAAGGFEMRVIPPAPVETVKAIPKWEPEEENEA